MTVADSYGSTLTVDILCVHLWVYRGVRIATCRHILGTAVHGTQFHARGEDGRGADTHPLRVAVDLLRHFNHRIESSFSV